MSTLDRMALWLALVLVTILLAMHPPRLRSVPAPTVQPTPEVAVTATQHAMVDSVQAMMARVGWRVRCYTVLLSKKHWSPGGVCFTVEIDSLDF